MIGDDVPKTHAALFDAKVEETMSESAAVVLLAREVEKLRSENERLVAFIAATHAYGRTDPVSVVRITGKQALLVHRERDGRVISATYLTENGVGVDGAIS